MNQAPSSEANRRDAPASRGGGAGMDEPSRQRPGHPRRQCAAGQRPSPVRRPDDLRARIFVVRDGVHAGDARLQADRAGGCSRPGARSSRCSRGWATRSRRGPRARPASCPRASRPAPPSRRSAERRGLARSTRRRAGCRGRRGPRPRLTPGAKPPIVTPIRSSVSGFDHPGDCRDHDCTHTVRPQPDGLPPHRRGADGAVQLAAGPPSRRPVPPADRRHRPAAARRGGRRR